MVTKEFRADLVKLYGGEAENTGKPEVQIALISARISDLTTHLIANKKDHHTRRGLVKMINNRRKLLDYLVKTDITRYRSIIAALKLRK